MHHVWHRFNVNEPVTIPPSMSGDEVNTAMPAGLVVGSISAYINLTVAFAVSADYVLNNLILHRYTIGRLQSKLLGPGKQFDFRSFSLRSIGLWALATAPHAVIALLMNLFIPGLGTLIGIINTFSGLGGIVMVPCGMIALRKGSDRIGREDASWKETYARLGGSSFWWRAFTSSIRLEPALWALVALSTCLVGLFFAMTVKDIELSYTGVKSIHELMCNPPF